MVVLTWADFERDVELLAKKIPRGKYDALYGIPRGGLLLAVMLSHMIDLPVQTDISFLDKRRFLVVDDISDCGATLNYVLKEQNTKHPSDTATVYLNTTSTFIPTYYGVKRIGNEWLKFPYERDNKKDTVSKVKIRRK